MGWRIWFLTFAFVSATAASEKEADAIARQAHAFDAAGRPDRAVVEYQKAIRLDPAKEAYYTELAHVLLRTQNFAEAITVLEYAQPRFPASAQVALSLGVGYYGQRRFADAVGAFLNACKLDPDAEQPHLFLGRVLEHASARMQEVTERFAQFVERNPNHWMGHFLLGKASAQEEPLRKAIKLKPDFWEAHFELASVLEQKRDFPSAIAEYQLAAKCAPKHPQPHYRLYRLYVRTSQPEKAAAERALHEKLTADEKAELDRRQAEAKHMELKTQ